MKSEGLSEEQARARIFMVDRFGLLTDKLPNLLNFQSKLITKSDIIADWDVQNDAISLEDVVRNAKPTVLIGVSGQRGCLRKRLSVKCTKLCASGRHAAVQPDLPCGSPSGRYYRWTDGHALVATGSPFNPVIYKDKTYPISQCNNSFIFRGLAWVCWPPVPDE